MCATGNLSMQICPGIRHLALVVCPLNALMRDQVDRWRKVGVSCAAILGKTAMCEEDVTGMLDEFHNFSSFNIQDGKIWKMFTGPTGEKIWSLTGPGL